MTTTHIKTITPTNGATDKRTQQINLAEAPYKPSRRTRGQAIKAMCQECICDEAGFGNCAMQVTLCTSWSCPLWDYRPVSSIPIPEYAMKGLPEHLLDRDWCSDPANYRTRPYVGAEKKRIDAIVKTEAT